jgi:hypothetical protein
MGQYSFVKENNIRFSREVVDEHIKKLSPLKYNRFMWWRTHTDNVTPLGKRATLKERILNGDFNPSSYFWQAQLSLYNALDKVDLTKHDRHRQMEILAVDLARHKRLMQDFEKEEPSRLKDLYDAFTSAFQLTRDELEEKLLQWPGDILGFYESCCSFLRTTPAENRKNNRRGRPKKEKIQVTLNQPKRKRGRPKKYV